MHQRINRLGRAGLNSAALALLAVLFAPGQLVAAPEILAIQARALHVGDGHVIDQGVLLIVKGRIVKVGSRLAIPEGATVLEVPSGTVTPGLIDANARIESTNLLPDSRGPSSIDSEATANDDGTPSAGPIGPEEMKSGPLGSGPAFDEAPYHVGEEPDHEGDAPFSVGVRPTAMVNEQGSEVVPHTRVLDGLNLESVDFERLVRGGVTTVYASPDASAVIAARGAVVHTAGPLETRVLVPAAAVKATVGSDPSYFGTYNRRPSWSSVSMYARRPNSRMGLVWVFRKAFYDAQRRDQGLPAYGADTASPEATAVLKQVLEGKVGLRVQARIQRDILTAFRLTDEFHLHFTLEEGTEAYLCLDELQARQVPVVFGPIYESPSGIRARSGEGRRSRYFTFRALLEAGIPTALSAQEYREEDGLARQAMYAMRFGVSRAEALRAVTKTPAQILGLDRQIGTLEAGKRADVLVWSGPPFDAASRIVAVLIDGQIVVDRRTTQP